MAIMPSAMERQRRRATRRSCTGTILGCSSSAVIAATDSSGGAGITRDVQVLADFSADVLCVITAVTAQSDSQLTDIHHIPPEVIRAQITAAFQTRQVDAIKIGMLGTRATVDAVADSLPQSVSIPASRDQRWA